MIELTARQQAVRRFIKGYIGQYGYAPSFKAIGERFNITTPNARKHVLALAAKGILSHTEGVARSIVMGNKNIPTGEPEDAVE